jgi:hypothetical protein
VATADPVEQSVDGGFGSVAHAGPGRAETAVRAWSVVLVGRTGVPARTCAVHGLTVADYAEPTVIAA